MKMFNNINRCHLFWEKCRHSRLTRFAYFLPVLLLVTFLLFSLYQPAFADGILSVTPNQATQGDTAVQLRIELDPVTSPPETVAVQEIRIGSELGYNTVREGDIVTTTFDFPAGMPTEFFTFTVIFPGPPPDMIPVVFELPNGFEILPAFIPFANDDEYILDEDTVLTVANLVSGVLGNDMGTILTATVDVTPTAGILNFSTTDGTFAYTPTTDFNGTDIFTYIADNGTFTDTATVTLTVNASNDAPIAVGDSYTATEDTPLTITNTVGVLSNDTDIDNAILTATLATTPTNGTVNLQLDGDFTYTPTANFNGTDHFDYIVSDGVLTDTASVNINIDPTDDPITAIDDDFLMGEGAYSDSVVANDIDVDNDGLTVTVVTAPNDGVLALATDGSFTYTPTLSYIDTDQFTYELTDGVFTDTATATLTQWIAADDDYTAFEDTVLNVPAFGVRNNDQTGSIFPDITILNPPTSGEVTVNSNGSFVYTPTADFTGVVNFTYGFVVEGNNANTALGYWSFDDMANPTADLSYSGHDATLVGDPIFVTSDISGADFGNAIELDGNGDYLVVGGNESDFDLNELTVAFWIKVNNFNVNTQAMITKGDDSWRIARRGTTNNARFPTTGLSPAQLNGSINVNDGEWHHVATTFDGTTKILYIDGVLDATSTVNGTINNGDYEVRIGSNAQQANREFDGQFDDVYIYDYALTADEITDLMAQTQTVDKAIVTITVQPVADAPTAVDDAYSVSEDTTLTVAAPGVLANDSDPDSPTLTASLATPPVNGTLDFQTDGGFTYTPTLGFMGMDTFTYTVSDGVFMDTATVTLDVADNCWVRHASDGTVFSSANADAVQEAIDGAMGGEMLQIAGICTGTQTRNGSDQTGYISQTLTLQGGYTYTNWITTPNPIANPTILDADGSGRVLFVDNSDVTIENLTLTNGFAAGDGAGIYAILTSTLTISNSQIISNTTQDAGAGIAAQNVPITIINSELAYNQAPNNDGFGGGVLATGSISVTVSNSSFHHNTAFRGAGMYLDFADTQISQTTFISNTAAFAGGALHITNESTHHITDSIIEGNHATSGGVGGVIAGVNTDITIDNTSISNNTSNAVCSALYSADGTLRVLNSTIANNQGDSQGIVCLLTGAGGNVDGINIISNTIIMENNALFTGAILAQDATSNYLLSIDIHNSHILSNTTTTLGGGFYLQGDGFITATNTTIAYNSTDMGAGIYNVGSTFTAINSTISHNNALTTAGGIYNDNGTINLNHVTLAGNENGGIYNAPPNFTAPTPLPSLLPNLVLAEDRQTTPIATIRQPSALLTSTTSIHNSIIANNSGGDCIGDLSASGGYNLDSDNSCGLNATGDITGTNPLLGELADNGGDTATHALPVGSPALNQIPAGNCTLATDQRGIPRPQDGLCDMGAFEAVFAITPTLAISTSSGTATLSWADDNPLCTTNIYRSTAPYAGFAPWQTNVGTTSYDISADTGDPAINYFYYLQIDCGGSTATSSTVGEFDFAIVPGL